MDDNKSFLEIIREMKEHRSYDIEDIMSVEQAMEDELGEAEMWRILLPAFSSDELLENLEYIARDVDI